MTNISAVFFVYCIYCFYVLRAVLYMDYEYYFYMIDTLAFFRQTDTDPIGHFLALPL